MNTLTIDGRLGGDPTFKIVGEKGTEVASFSVANSEYTGKSPSGEAKYKTTWVRVTCWGYLAKRVQTLKKGDAVVVVGKLSVSEYTNKDDEKKQAIEVNAEQVMKVEKLSAGEDTSQGAFADWKNQD